MNRLLLGNKLHILHRAACALLFLCAWFGASTAQAASPGTVVAWGAGGLGQSNSPNYGQSIVPSGLSNVAAITAGVVHTVALTSNGTVVAWGKILNNNGSAFVVETVPDGLSNVMAIAAGAEHTVVLQSNGTVMAWGYNGSGQTAIPASLSGVVAVAAGGNHTAVLKNDDTVVAWGRNVEGQSTIPVGLSNVAAIAAGGSHTAALTSNGTVVAWGYNYFGQTTIPAGLSGVTAIAAGANHTAALRSDGTVTVWGYNEYGQVTGTPTITSPLSATANPVILNGIALSGVTAIAAGGYQTLALKSNGTVVAWGKTFNGSAWIDVTVPIGLSGVTAIAAGGYHAVALLGTIPNTPPVLAAIGNKTIGEGTLLTFTASATDGDVPAQVLTYSLSNGPAGAVINGVSGVFTWTPNVVQGGMSYPVTVQVSDGSLTDSETVSLSVTNFAAAITTEPANLTVNVGQSAKFSVVSTGTSPLSYQWIKDGTNIPSATNATYMIAAVADSDSGNYSVVVTNAVGSVTSSNAVLTVLNVPVFTAHPLSQAVGVGSNVTLSATAYGTLPLVFQWYFNNSPAGSPVSGTNVVFYALSNVQTNNSGKYSVQVFNGYGSAMSSTAVLSVVVFPPNITMQPSNQNPMRGHSASFVVSVNGTAPFLYQWRFNGATISGATNAAYTIPAVAESDAGNYSVVVSNSALSVASANATLTVVVPPTLGLQMLAGYPLLSLNGMQGSNFNVQFNTNLAVANWFNLLSISNLSVHPYQFLDPTGSNQPARFYRAVMQ